MVTVKIGSKIEIKDDGIGFYRQEINPLLQWCEENLVVTNSMYEQLMRLGKEDTIRFKHVPEKLYLYVQKGNSIIVPFGCLYGIWKFIKDWKLETNFNVSGPLGIQNCELPIELYDYQKKAVESIVRARGGVLVAPCGAGKGLPLNTKVYTPTGWKYNGELQVGDKIIGSNGKATTVTHIFDRGLVEAYKIYFSDETSQECDKDHLWNVQNQDDRTNNRKFKTMSTEEIYDYYQKIKTRGKELFIPIVEPVQFEKKEVNIDPWLLGILLSDGNIAKHNVMISNNEKDILERIEKIIGSKLKKDANRLNYNIRDNATTLNKLRQLKLDGVLSYSKFIPKDFLYNDIETRLSLLQGLFDGDGTVDKKEKGCNYEYSTSSKQLAEDFVELIQSLGGTAKIKQKIPTYIYKGEKKTGKVSYRVFFKLYKYKPFSSKKHYSKYSERTNYKKAYRKIVKIEKISPIQSRCIKVDAKDSLYVIQNFIVTHNTIMGIELIHRINRKFLWLTHTKDLLNQALDDMKQLFPNIDVGLITEGKIDIGRDGAIATIQTLVNIDPDLYADQFEIVVVDECAHCAGSPTISKMFSKVVTKIPARYKFGLTATPERSDTLIKTMYTILGMSPSGNFEPTYKIDRKDVKTIEAEHLKFDVDLNYGYGILNSDGTLDYNTLIDFLSDHEERNNIILDNIEKMSLENRKQVVLCHRVRHVEELYNKLAERGFRVKMVVGKVSNKKRKEILENCDNWDIMVATYSLLKEGISIKELDTLHLCTPQKNKSMIVQCAGRIERYLENKNQPLIFDYVDINVPYCLGAYRKRKSSLKNRF